MNNYDVIVIGGSAAGIPAAITARRHYPDKSIMLIRKEGKVPIPCGIPYIFGTVGSTDKNLIPDAVFSNNDIELLIDEVQSIERKAKSVVTAGGERISYDKLVLSTGAEPLQLPIKGIDKENVFYAKKDVSYLDDLLHKLDNVRNVVVIGGGFIGVEFADELNKRGPNVTIIEMLPRCLMLAFDEDLCIEAEEKLKSRGINIVTNNRVEEILGNEIVTGVRLADGKELMADIVFVGVGVIPNIALAEKADLEVNHGGIVVDSNMKTTDDNIFACGDCVDKKSFFTGKQSGLRLASIATTEARIVGANLFEQRRKSQGVTGVFSTAIGDLVLATAGLTNKQAQDNGFNVTYGEAEAPDRHPGGMPGMSKMKVSLIFNKGTGELIGGQVRGGTCAGELINTISACINNRMTADDIAMFQIGTHPAVTASPIAYQLVNAAEMALTKQ
ncbi:MAG: FAD-dependent oxidoreductase [Deltaproteobacteria bacterium]|jgi:NADH oxidase (H2O2-forming)|nr:FAD-dependent oxidoreductase [Deltaproteobacteria bacterium]